jgi:hypothetical protein
MDAGVVSVGFRSYKAEKMTDIEPADNLFNLIPKDIIERYPELGAAK